MIVLWILLGGALFVALGFFVGRPAVIAIGALFAVLVLIGIASDLRRIAHDRATGMGRLRQMRSNDALNRILDGRLRRG